MWNDIESNGHWEGEIWNRRKNGEVYPSWLNINPVRDENGALLYYVGMFSDISKRKEAEAQIHQLAFYDPLTKLPNRRLLIERLQQAFSVGARSGQHGAVLFIDLDNFKTLNDTKGHDIGDQLLAEVANAAQYLRTRWRYRGAPGRRRVRGGAGIACIRPRTKRQRKPIWLPKKYAMS